MKELVNTYLNLFFKVGLSLLILSTFLLFTNLTTDFYDPAKFLILLIFTGVMLLGTTAKYTIENKVSFRRTPFDLPLILLLVVAIVSTVLSPSPYVALLGHQARIHGSLVSLALYILFFFILMQNLKREGGDIKWILNISIWAGALLSIITLASYFGVKFLPASPVPNFTPTGSSFSTTAILAMLLPVLVSKILGHLGNLSYLSLSLNSLFLILFGLTIALTGTWATWIGASVATILTFYILNPLKELASRSEFNFDAAVSKPPIIFGAASIFIIFVIVALSFIPPVGGGQNPLYTQAKNFPRELQLGFITSWKTSASAFRDSPFWGTGPGTSLFNFTTYKPIEFNNTRFWNIRFDTSFNEYLGVLGTLGGVGLLAFAALIPLFVSSILSVFSKNPPAGGPLNVAVCVGGIVFFTVLLLHASTLPVFIVGFIILACFWTLNLKEEGDLSFTHESLRQLISKIAGGHESQTIRIEALPSVLFIVSLVLVAFTAFFASKFYLAEIHHRNALNAVSQNNGILAYNELIASEKLNPYSDLYRTDLAQVNFALANAIAAAKGPAEASPAGSLTEQDKQNIQVLLQQSIQEARTAVTLSPRSVVNWEILALLYRQIAGVAQNALLFSLDAYGRAIFNDPLNPILRLNVGGVYYAAQNYDLAIRFFTDAINLKPDYANGFYNLSVTLRDKGDLNGAIFAAERTLALIDQASADYKVAQDYLADLKAKVEGPPDQPPAAEATGALQEEKLPKVISLPKPEKIATPEAIKASPSPSPTP